MRDMRGVLIEEGDTVIGIALYYLDYSIGVVIEANLDKGLVYLDNYDEPFNPEDCLVLPSYYKEKIVE